LIPELKQVKTMAIGTNHALALTHKGKAFVWGAGEQSQLGRRVVARTASGALVPREFGFQRKTIVDIATGDYFSYAVEKNGTIYAWGHNGYGQTGISTDQNVDDIVPVPTVVDALKGRNIQQLAGGNHHTIARTRDGEILVWGRLDNLEGGLKIEDMPEDSLIRNQESGRVLASKKPITVPDINAQYVATGTDTNFAIDQQGRAYAWGFSTNYQTGLGTSDDVVEATLVDNTAVRGKQLIFAGVGGQFGVLACEKEDKTASTKN
jgi:regulator of chromosome condensation